MSDAIICPLPECDAELYLTIMRTVPLGYSSSTASLNEPRSAVSSGWEVVCAEGHTLLLPEGADDDNRFEVADIGRLRRLVGWPTIGPAPTDRSET